MPSPESLSRPNSLTSSRKGSKKSRVALFEVKKPCTALYRTQWLRRRDVEGSIRRALSTNRGSLPETAFSSCFTCSLISVEDQRRKTNYFQLLLVPYHSKQVVLGSLFKMGRMWPIISFVLTGLTNTYGCHTLILSHNQATKKNKAGVREGVKGDRKKEKMMRNKTKIFIRSLNGKTF